MRYIDGREAAKDVYIQDQTSTMVDVYMCILQNMVTLASAASVGDYTLTLTTGHGFIVGEYICLREEIHYLQAQVLAVAGDVITIDQPVNYPFSTSAGGARQNTNGAVNGSVTPVVMGFQPYQNIAVDVTRIIMFIEAEDSGDGTTFGGISALTNGIVFRKKENSHYVNYFNAKKNNDFAGVAYDINYDDRAAPQNDYTVRVRRTFGGQDKAGVVIRLDGVKTPADQLQVLIQDDLTDLIEFKVRVQGHYVED